MSAAQGRKQNWNMVPDQFSGLAGAHVNLRHGGANPLLLKFRTLTLDQFANASDPELEHGPRHGIGINLEPGGGAELQPASG